MTKLKDQPWYEPYMGKKYPSSLQKMRNLKFIPGKIYVATTYRGSKRYYFCEKRADSGFIYFREFNIRNGKKEFDDESIRRKPVKGWEGSDERVIIDKGTFGRVCWTGGITLYARNLYNNKKERR